MIPILLAAFSVGFAKVDITPPLGIYMPGYYEAREADGVLDNLYATAVMFSDGKRRALLIAVDNLHLYDEMTMEIRRRISEKTRIPEKAIIVHSSHTHTGGMASLRPLIIATFGIEARHGALMVAYGNQIVEACVSAAAQARKDLSPATLSIVSGRCQNVCHLRRYVMKNGEIKTFPGMGDPGILRPAGTADDEFRAAFFNRGKKTEIVIVNFQNHADSMGGTKISADWVGCAREAIEKLIPNTECMIVNGAEGDLEDNPYFRPDMGDLELMRDPPKWIRKLGMRLARAVTAAYPRRKKQPVEMVAYGEKEFEAKLIDKVTDIDLIAKAREVVAAHREGRKEDIKPFGKFRGMEIVPGAERILSTLEWKETSKKFTVYSIALGKSLAFAGLPCEPFCEIGRRIRGNSPFEMTMPMCLTMTNIGYIPHTEAFEEGGYETAVCAFKPEIAEVMINGMGVVLKKLYQFNSR